MRDLQGISVGTFKTSQNFVNTELVHNETTHMQKDLSLNYAHILTAFQKQTMTIIHYTVARKVCEQGHLHQVPSSYA